MPARVITNTYSLTEFLPRCRSTWKSRPREERRRW